MKAITYQIIDTITNIVCLETNNESKAKAMLAKYNNVRNTFVIK